MTKAKAVRTSRFTHICTLTFPNEILYDDFCVDIIYNFKEAEYEAWIYRKDYGTKLHMFSFPGERCIETVIEYTEIRFRDEAEHYNGLVF